MREYTPKFVPGDHYVKAHEAIASKEYGVQGKKNGAVYGQGTISQSQAQSLLTEGLEISEPDDYGCVYFIIPYERFEKMSDEYRRLKDEWIEENNAEITPL